MWAIQERGTNLLYVNLSSDAIWLFDSFIGIKSGGDGAAKPAYCFAIENVLVPTPVNLLEIPQISKTKTQETRILPRVQKKVTDSFYANSYKHI